MLSSHVNCNRESVPTTTRDRSQSDSVNLINRPSFCSNTGERNYLRKSILINSRHYILGYYRRLTCKVDNALSSLFADIE